MKINIKIPENFYDEEVRNEYFISKKMKKVWAVQIDLMKKVLDVCEKYNLKIFVDGGTLLGTIRHNGYIPWDDDIDLTMLRDDYNKLCKIGQAEFKDLYFFQIEETDNGSSRGHIQIRNNCSTAILKNEGYKFEFNQGIFIDIFPLDFLPNDEVKKRKFLKKLKFKKMLVNKYKELVIAKYIDTSGKVFIKKIIHFIFSLFNKFMKGKNIFEKSFENTVQKYNHKKNCDYVSSIALSPYREKGFFKKQYFDEVIFKRFEMFEVPVPKEYEKILDELYGDWHKFQRGTSMHGDVIFDTEKCYKEYLK